MKPSTAEIQVKDLNHYGIIAGIIDEIGLVEKIDELVGTHYRQKVTPGLAVKAMIVNGNDDCLGRVLDKLSAQGLTKIFVTVALHAAKKMGVKSNSLHLDSSSFHVDGKYAQAFETEESQTAAITITHGYSRDHRPVSTISIKTKLSGQQFACEADAMGAANRFEAKLTFHQLDNLQIIQKSSHSKTARPRKSQSPTKTYYRIKADLILNQVSVDVEQCKAGRFILATNVLDSAVLSNSAVLQEYKAQQSTERGFRCLGARSLASYAERRVAPASRSDFASFGSCGSHRFLKDPLFFTSSIFLKSPHRVAALAMVMGLCLLVYNLGQRSLRLALQAADQTIPNQLGKPISTPTLRWIFQCFMSVHLITFAGVKQISNLTSERSHILQFLSSYCRQYYLLC